MADVKNVIVVHEDGTTKEFDRFVGAFIDGKRVLVTEKDVEISEMALIVHMISKDLDRKMQEIIYREECEND